MKASDIIADMMRGFGVPNAHSIEQAVRKARAERAPEAIKRIVAEATAEPEPIDPFEALSAIRSGELAMLSAYTGYGKTFYLQQQIERLREMGYEVVLQQRIGEPTVIEAKSDDDFRMFEMRTFNRLRLRRLDEPAHVTHSLADIGRIVFQK